MGRAVCRGALRFATRRMLDAIPPPSTRTVSLNGDVTLRRLEAVYQLRHRQYDVPPNAKISKKIEIETK
jgi:hypothetical protein